MAERAANRDITIRARAPGRAGSSPRPPQLFNDPQNGRALALRSHNMRQSA